MEGCTGWRISPRNWPPLALRRTWPTRRRRRGPGPQTARQNRQNRLPALEGLAGRGGRLPECWVPPAHILEYRALLELYHDLRGAHRPGAAAPSSSTRAPRLGEGALRTGPGLAALREAAAARLSPAGQLQVAAALDMLAAIEARMDVLRTQLRAAARHLTGAKVLAARLYGVGPVTALALTCWLGGAGRFSSSPRRSGSPGWTSPSGLRTARARRGGCPAGAAGAALGGV